MSNTKRLLKVFLCHASQDKPIVRQLHQRLNAEGWIDSWLDEKKLLPGQNWRLKIEEAVETSDIVIIFLSNNSVNKEGFIQKEMGYAREIALEKLDQSIFLIPARISECDVPRGLRLYQWADYFGEKKDEVYADLLKSLQIRYEQILNFEKDAQEKENQDDKEYKPDPKKTFSNNDLDRIFRDLEMNSSMNVKEMEYLKSYYQNATLVVEGNIKKLGPIEIEIKARSNTNTYQIHVTLESPMEIDFYNKLEVGSKIRISGKLHSTSWPLPWTQKFILKNASIVEQ